MTVRELIMSNSMLTDIEICVRKAPDNLVLTDFYAVGPDFGFKPPYPHMVPLNEYGTLEREGTYECKSINSHDDGKEFWEIKVNRIPERYLNLEVFSWCVRSVYAPRHVHKNPGNFNRFDGIEINALLNTGCTKQTSHNVIETVNDGQLSIEGLV